MWTPNLPIFPYQNVRNNRVLLNSTSKQHFSSLYTRKPNNCLTKYKNSTSHQMTHFWGCVLLRTVRASFQWLKTTLLNASNVRNNFVENACTLNTMVNAQKTKQSFWTWNTITVNVKNVGLSWRRLRHAIIWHADVETSFVTNAVKNGLGLIIVQS